MLAAAPFDPAWALPSKEPPAAARALGPRGCDGASLVVDGLLLPEGLLPLEGLLLPEGFPVDEGWPLVAPMLVAPKPDPPTFVVPFIAPADPAAPAAAWPSPAVMPATVDPSFAVVPAAARPSAAPAAA